MLNAIFVKEVKSFGKQQEIFLLYKHSSVMWDPFEYSEICIVI